MKWSYTASALAGAALVCAAPCGCSKAGCGSRSAPAVRDGGPVAAMATSVAAPPLSATPAAAASAPARPTDAGAARAIRFEKPIEIGPAGATAAPSGGVVYRTTDDAVVLVPIGRAAKPPAELDGAAIAFDAPAVTASRAYFVSRGRLVSRVIAPAVGPIETLASDALDGTYVAAASAGARDVVAYIARPAAAKADRRARLWVHGEARTYELSEEGAGASGVALASAGGRAWAVSFDERTAMSPLHVRTVDVPSAGPPRLGPDVVAWVGPACEVHTEIAMTAAGGEPVVLAPLSDESTGFGLAAIPIGREPHMDSVARYRRYPNGLDPAPVAVADACGGTWVAYVRPAAAAPGSPNVIAVAPLEGGVLGDEIALGEAGRITAASFAGGAVVWWADGRSWARVARCK